MKCECNNDMTIIKTTGKAYTYMCFNCGQVKTEPKAKPKKWYERLFKVN